MSKKIKLIIALAAAVVLGATACAENASYWSSGDWQKGVYRGTSKLTAKESRAPDAPGKVIETGTGGFTWNESASFTLSEETPLPSCRIETYPWIADSEDRTFKLQNLSQATRGSSKSGIGCWANVGGFRADFENGSFKRDENGDVVFTIVFESGKYGEPYYEYELRARKTSWF